MASVASRIDVGDGRGARRWRPRRPRTRRGTALFTGAIVAIALFVPVAASEFLDGDTPSVAANETVEGDLYVVGREVEIAGNVTKDVFVAAETLTITDDGEVGGSVNGLMRRIDVDGLIQGSLHVAADEVRISGTVEGDLLVASGSLVIEEGASVAGDIVVTGGDVEIFDGIGGDLRGSASSLVIDAAVAGDVRITSDDIELGSEAEIAGRLDYTSGDEADVHPNAEVQGGIDRDAPERFGLQDGLVGWLSGVILKVLWLLVAGAVLIMLLPRGCVAVANGARHRPWRTALFGLLMLILAPIALVILMITIVGLPIAVIGLAAYLATLYLSQIFVGLAIGRFLLPNRWGDFGRGFNLLAMTIGVLILAGLRLIPLPFVSELIAFVVAVVGLGAVALGPRYRPIVPAISPPAGHPRH